MSNIEEDDVHMEIREIQSQDDTAMARILRSCLEQLHLNLPGTAYFDPNVDHLSEWYRKTSAAKYFVAVNDQHVVGGCGVGPIAPDDGIAELQKLYVDPGYRQHGAAKQLMRVCLEYAKANYGQLYLETFASMTAANHLYQQSGFHSLSKPLAQSEHGACDTWYLLQLH